MEGYELTDRGKIVITVVLVVLLLFLPAAILLFHAMAGQSSQLPDDQDLQASFSPPSISAETPNPPITESPPPNGGGFNPPEVSQPNGDGDPGTTPSQNGQAPSRPPGSGQSSVNPTEGTLSFLFSPNLQSSLDDETSSMLDEFLRSPKNTTNSIIAVKTPQLSLDVSQKFVSIIVDSFAKRDVPETRLAYITDSSVPLADGSFEVDMSFISRRPK